MRLLFSVLLLGLAWFAFANLVLSASAWTLSRSFLGRDRPLSGGVLLTLRLLPAAGAALFVAFGFIPAHVLFEPADADETFGVVLYALAAVGLLLVGRGLLRAVRVARGGRAVARLVRDTVDTPCGRAYAVDGFDGVSLAGVVRPRILFGEDVRRILTREELHVAIAHEAAHRRALDNVKRCLLYCLPDLFGSTAAAQALESRWRADAECAADAMAVAGDARRAVHLASALVKVARQGAGRRRTSPAWSTLHEPALLEARVRRLVTGELGDRRRGRPLPLLATLAMAVTVAWAAGLLGRMHELTELLVSTLP